jgi:hypothetical protein
MSDSPWQTAPACLVKLRPNGSGRTGIQKRGALLLAWAALTLQASAGIYVAPNGDDASAGTREQPLASLSRAAERARALPKDQPRQIVLHGGNYWNVGLVLSPEDSGLSIEAEPGETPRLYGGQRLSGWVKEGALVSAALPVLPAVTEDVNAGMALPQWEVRLLLVNGQSRVRARFPEAGELTHRSSFDVRWMSSTGGGWQRKPTEEELTTLRYQPGDLPAGLEVRDAEVTVYHMWDESCVGIASHDPSEGVLKLAPLTGHPPGAFGVKKFVVWNTREGLTRPGQWYHDRVRNRIVYWPLPGEDMDRVEVVVPTRTKVFRIQGTANKPVRQVALRRLAIHATTTPLITGGFAAAAFDGAVSLENAQDCAFDQLTIQGVAGHGIDARRSCVNIQVSQSEITDCGAGGIYVGGVGARISDNHVHGVGRAYPSALGIFRGGRQCVVAHNEVHDCTYSAINYGGIGNVVEYNLIYDCMKVLHDGAAIYMFAARDCILRGNVARDIVDTGGYGASAYYLDERSTGCLVEQNLALRVARPLHNHMATNNVIRENVFVVDGDAKLTFPRSTEFTMDRNVLYATGKIRVEGMNAVTNWTRNVFFSAAGQVDGVSLREYETIRGPEPLPDGVMVADPLFNDWRNGDYQFKDGSLAIKLGLAPIDVRRAGRRPLSPGDKER